MKISLKIFIFTYCIIVVTTVLGGFVLIHYEYEKNLEQAKSQAAEQNESLFTYVATLEELLDKERAEQSLNNLIKRMNGEDNKVVFVDSFDNLQDQLRKGGALGLQSGEWKYAFFEEKGRQILQVTGRYEDKYIINCQDISEIFIRRDENYALYQNIILLVSCVIAVVLYLFSWYITRPLAAVTAMADKLSDGDYSARVDSSYRRMKSYEVERLGKTLNEMAARTEGHIREIKEEARRKEEFMGNFAHEMKTPMTSIIGYADMLRSFDLEPEKRRAYSNFIYNEGKRVEQLSLNLLQLIVLDKKDYELQRITAEEFFEYLKREAVFLSEKYHVQLYFKKEPAVFCVEKSLMLTAVLNLIDNACKASGEGSGVYILGKNMQEYYGIAVVDYGVGIPEAEVSKITEPFYMVDKSRSRKQGGAGLGLSLCQKIVELHGGKLRIDSKVQEGTRVTVFLKKEVLGQ